MLLNRVLTVEPGKPGARHRGQGWEEVTQQAIQALAARSSPLVAILWGRDARSLAPLLGGARCIESAHPSPNWPTAASSARGHSPGPTSYWSRAARSPSTGSCRSS